MIYGSETRPLLVDVGLKFASRDTEDDMDAWRFHERLVKNSES